MITSRACRFTLFFSACSILPTWILRARGRDLTSPGGGVLVLCSPLLALDPSPVSSCQLALDAELLRLQGSLETILASSI